MDKICNHRCMCLPAGGVGASQLGKARSCVLVLSVLYIQVYKYACIKGSAIHVCMSYIHTYVPS